jgi:lipoprotein-anchoring transpeptidase ErfK/SrfK
VLAVVARRPGWLGVLSHYMPNSKAGWIPADAAELRYMPYTIDVDLSALRLLVRHDGKVVRRVTVAVGRPGHETPTGRYAITDTLRVSSAGGPYGCCALALTGRQPNVPQGWTGGDRIAIHGTNSEDSLGTPASSGCVRASDVDMRWMMKRIPVGAQVRIKA